MKYFHILFDGVQYWIETDDSYYAMRQINIEGDTVEISSFQDCLSEVRIIEDELEGEIKLITSEEFNVKWNNIIKGYTDIWEEAKKLNPIGTKAEGKVICFYPQGTILEIGNVRGIYSHDVSVKVGQTITGVVGRYDEKNMWLILVPEVEKVQEQ